MDDRLRRLERRWHELGTPEARAEYQRAWSRANPGEERALVAFLRDLGASADAIAGPHGTAARARVAWAAAQLDQRAEALAGAERALSSLDALPELRGGDGGAAPSLVRALGDLALAFEHLGRRDQAQASFERVFAIALSSWPIWRTAKSA